MSESVRKGYRSDLTDEQWERLEGLIPSAKHAGRRRSVNVREVINTILYLHRNGCQWEYIPHDLVPKSTTFDDFKRWQEDGTWPLILDTLRESARIQAGREATCSEVDSPSVKTGRQGGERGYDGGKRSRAATGICFATKWSAPRCSAR